MRKILLLFFLIALFPNTHAQDYLITFAGSGASSIVDSVIVENITQCKDTILAGSDVLHLMVTLNSGSLPAIQRIPLSVWPNPFTDHCFLEFELPETENVTVGIFTVAGKQLIQTCLYLRQGHQLLQVNGIGQGIYLVSVRSKSCSYAARLASVNPSPCIPGIVSIAVQKLLHSPECEASRSVIEMQYTAGDLLKITGKSGIYRTIVMLVPTQSQLVTFPFVDCTDADMNHYAIVQIGSQLWMAENMKTTKYRDGSAIPEVPDSAGWSNLTTGAWCNYHNDTTEAALYGHLYNWYAAGNVRNLAPMGWHVSSDTEWTVLIDYLGGDAIAGQKLKENCSTRWAYIDTTWGTNVAGFSARCANFRSATGAWSLAPNNDHDCFFWTTTEFSLTSAFTNALRYCYRDVWRSGFPNKKQGASVRCIHD